jgi:hypothetical protein
MQFCEPLNRNEKLKVLKIFASNKIKLSKGDYCDNSKTKDNENEENK